MNRASSIPDRRRIRSDAFWEGIARTEHILQVYGNESVFLDALEGFVGSGLRAEEAVIVVASARHLHELEKRLRGRWLDVDRARWQGRYFPLLATETLEKVVFDGEPAEERFNRMAQKLIALARGKGTPVRLFVEMVAGLTGQLNPEATLRLEKLWGEIAKQEQIPLFCAYSQEALDRLPSVPARAVSDGHSMLLPG